MKGITSVKHLCASPNGCSFASFSPSGSFFLVGSDSELIRLCSLHELEPEDYHTFSDHEGFVNWGEVSKDEKKLATCSNDKTVLLYSLITSKVVKRLDHHNLGVSWCTFSPDSLLLCTCSWDNSGALCDTESGDVVATLLGHRNPVTSADFNCQFQLATSSWDKTIRVWDIQRKASCPMTGHTDVVWRVSYNPATPHVLASVSRDLTTGIWDTRMAGRVMAIRDTASLNCVKFSPDGTKLVTAGEDSTIVIRETANLVQPLRQTSGHRGKINSVSFSPCSRFMATAGVDGFVNIWDFQHAQDEVADLSDMLNFSDLMGEHSN